MTTERAPTVLRYFPSAMLTVGPYGAVRLPNSVKECAQTVRNDLKMPKKIYTIHWRSDNWRKALGEDLAEQLIAETWAEIRASREVEPFRWHDYQKQKR